MRVFMLVDCYYPSTKSSAKLMHDLGVELHRQGHEVLLMSPSESISEPLEKSTEDGILVARVRTEKIKGAGKVVRALREAQLSANLWSKAGDFLRGNPCELIVSYSPSIFFGLLVRRLKALWNCPAYLILRDIFPQWAVDAGILREGLVCWLFRRIEKLQYEAADLIAVQSPADLEYFKRTFPQGQFRLEVLYNWTTLRESNLPVTNLRAKLGLNGKVVFFYGGNIGVAQDMDNILRLAGRLAQREEIYFLLVGEGSEVVRLKKSIAEQGLNNIQILPPVGQQEYLSIVSEFDVGLVSLHSQLTTHNVPGKILSYLYCGIPVLASVNPGNDLFNLFGESQAGFCVVNGDDDNFVRATERLAKDGNLRVAMGGNARQLLEQTFSVEAAVQKIRIHLLDAGFVFPRSNSFGLVSGELVHRQSELAQQI